MSGLFPAMLPTRVPVISLWQPFASLLFQKGAGSGFIKDHETRGYRYPAKYDGCVVAVHATATFPACKHISGDLDALCREVWGAEYRTALPLGAIIGTVRLGGCDRTDLLAGFQGRDDIISGDWTSGRFAWTLNDRCLLVTPVPMKGKQGWWSIESHLLDNLPSRTPSGAGAMAGAHSPSGSGHCDLQPVHSEKSA